MTDGPTNSTRTQVAIVGAGPAGLLLAHMLQKRGVDSIAIDIRSRHEIETTHRAGILEDQNVQMLHTEGVSDRFQTVGYEHDGTELRLNGHGHRISFKGLVGSTVWLYAQTEMFIDLANASERDGRAVHFSVSGVSVEDHQTDNPRVLFTDAEGHKQEIVADFLVGSDGSRSICRFLIPEERRKQYFVEYPFAWFGVTIEAKMSSDELIYATSTKGFALIPQRSDTIQRWYLQAQPEDDMENWSDDQLFAAFDERVEGDGFQLVKRPITDKVRLPFRSFVQEPMQ